MTLKRIRKNSKKQIAAIAARTERVTVHNLDNCFDGEDREFESTDALAEYIYDAMNGDCCPASLVLDEERGNATLRRHSNSFVDLHLAAS